MRYLENRAVLEISVKEMCERALCRGSIKSKDSPIYESAKQKCRDSLTKRSGIFFKPDEELQITVSVSGIHYEVSGRADGILKDDKGITVYMISPLKGKRFAMPPTPIFLSESMCLAHLASSKFEAESIKLCIILLNVDTGKSRTVEKEYSSSALSREFMSILIKSERFAKLCINKALNVQGSIDAMRFPFGKTRPGQKELIEETYRAIYSGTRLFATAPTGIGKTISVLYPAVKALGKGLCHKIFYLTAKASTRREAFSAVKRMFEAGAMLKVMILNPKEQMCTNSAAKLSGGRVSCFCTAESCEMARDYYSRRDDALYELLTEANGYTPRLISEAAKKHNICPYELSLDLSEHCDIIICDYNYVFAPGAKLRRYFGELSEKSDENYVFLTDEAHNLADRAREMYSAELSLRVFEDHLSQLPIDRGRLSSAFEEIIRKFKSLKSLCADNLSKDDSGEDLGFYFSANPLVSFSEELLKFVGKLEYFSKQNPDSPYSDILYELISSVKEYLSILDYYDEHFRTYILVQGGNITLRAYCIDPSAILDICMNRACSSILFSATLTPSDYFVDVLGGSGKSATLSLPSPFPRKNL
ncbi:MAG: hypothetical protein IJ303_04850, partial [Clostridia bacterium]|nr:hypothetical protein [Clostridia bacterium]